jgi:hypothetical protein
MIGAIAYAAWITLQMMQSENAGPDRQFAGS